MNPEDCGLMVAPGTVLKSVIHIFTSEIVEAAKDWRSIQDNLSTFAKKAYPRSGPFMPLDHIYLLMGLFLCILVTHETLARHDWRTVTHHLPKLGGASYSLQ